MNTEMKLKLWKKRNSHENYLREVCGYGHILGEMLGYGGSRMVFIHKNDPDLVVKVDMIVCDPYYEKDVRSYNRDEWNVWNDNEDIREYLCPCVWISDDDAVLIMKRAEEQDQFDEEMTLQEVRLEMRLRGIVNDVNADNVGLYKGKLVVIDYAI